MIRNTSGRAQSVTFTHFGPGYAARGSHTLGADSPSTTEQAVPLIEHDGDTHTLH